MVDTIFALSSGTPPAAIAIVRISGPEALIAASALAGALPAPRRAGLRTLRDPASAVVLDRALTLVFPAPDSVTAEDVVEFHLHGGRAVVDAVERALGGMTGLRPAQAGEFTRRALNAGRIDLTEAEGLGDLLTAETEGQRRAAMAGADGGIRRRVEQWTATLLDLAAAVEAAIDFSDEDDVPAGEVGEIADRCASLAREIDEVVGVPLVERLRDGIRVVLAGPPNSGKSTLLNRLGDRQAAIVSPIAGTTRDRIDVPVMRDGIAYVLTDTAGLVDATDDAIEAVGVELARDAVASADVVLWLGDDGPPPGALWLLPRSDQRDRGAIPCGDRLAISAFTGEGIPDLWVRISSAAAMLLPRPDQLVLNRRQHSLARECRDHLRHAADHHDPILVAEYLRLARLALDRISGRADTEDMLDALFGRFCIGK